MPPRTDFKGFHDPEYQAQMGNSWFRPEFVAGVTGLPLQEIVNRMQDGRIVAVKTEQFGWRIPYKQVRLLMGLPTEPPVIVRDPDAIVE